MSKTSIIVNGVIILITLSKSQVINLIYPEEYFYPYMLIITVVESIIKQVPLFKSSLVLKNYLQK